MKLYDAIKEIVKLKGKKIITDSALLNYLNDYHAFEERPAAKLVLRDIINGGYADKILQLNNSESSWNVKLKSYEHDFVDSCGYKEELVLYVFQSVAYSIDLTEKKPGDGMDEVLDFHPFFDDEEEQKKPAVPNSPAPKQKADSVNDKDYLKIAQNFIDNSKLDTARSIAEKIVNSSPANNEDTIKAMIMLGHIMRKKNQYKEALDYYNQALNAEANLLNICAKDLQRRITNREVKDFEDIDIHYMFCLLWIGHIDNDRWTEFVRSKAANGNVVALLYCVQDGINPQTHVNVFFDDIKQLRLGDCLYDDGSFSHEISLTKMIVGRVFSLVNSDIEIHKGWKNGRIMAIPQLSKQTTFGVESACYPTARWGEKKDFPFPHTHYTSDDIKHFDKINSNLNSELLISNMYNSTPNAFSSAREWNMVIPLKKSSEWYLPNISQLSQCKPYLLIRNRSDFGIVSFWSSSQSDKDNALAIEWLSDKYSYISSSVVSKISILSKDVRRSVLPIFSF